MSNSVRPHRQQPTRLPHSWDSPGKNTGVGCHFLLQWMKVKSESEISQSCLTLSDPMDCSLLGSSIHGIFQARILEWVAISFSRVTSCPRDWTRVSHIVGRRFTVWATREAIEIIWLNMLCLYQRMLFRCLIEWARSMYINKDHKYRILYMKKQWIFKWHLN